MAVLRPARDHARKRTAHATEQDRPDVLKRREEWFDGQLDLDPDRLVFAPEVMLKVSGRQRGGSHTAAHLEYIGRHGKLDVETSDARTIENVAELRELAREWTEDGEAVSLRREQLTSVSMVFSIPPGTDADAVYRSVRAFARVDLEQFPHAMALHTDKDHPRPGPRVARELDTIY